MHRQIRLTIWLLAIVAPLCLAQKTPKDALGNAWKLAGLGGNTPPPAGSTFVWQKANILAMAGAAAQAVVQGAANGAMGSPPPPPATTPVDQLASALAGLKTSYVATSPGNAATPGQTNAKGLLVYKPKNSTFDAADFQTFFAVAFTNTSVPGVVLSSGTYFINNNGPSFHINLYCFNRPGNAPFELDFTGSTLYFQNYNLGGIGFFFCNTVYFHGPFNFMYTSAALPFSQGTITAYQPQGDGTALYTVQTDSGYPTTTTGLGDGQGHLCAQYLPNGQVVQNSSDIYSQPATALNAAGLYQFTANDAPNVVVGNKLAIRGNAGNHGIFLYKTVNFRLSYAHIFTAPIFGILETLCTNSTISNNIIQPWPYNIGNTRPLLSTNADGIHSSAGRNIGPSIVSNQVLSPGDDGIAVHGNFYTVYSSDPSTNSLIVYSASCGNDFCQAFFVGDPLTVYSTPYDPAVGTTTAVPGAFTNLGTAAVTGITLLNANAGGPPDGTTGGASAYPLVNYASGYYYNFSFTSFPAGFAQAGKDSLVSDTLSNGNNFAISKNAVNNHRARGIFNKASNGIINNNVVQNPTIYALYIAPDLYFLESDFAQNVSVISNYASSAFGPLQQYVQNPADGSILITQNFKNINYQSNTFDNAGTWATAISSASNISFISNLIRNAGCYPFVYGQNSPFIPATTLSYEAQISNLTVRGNAFQTTRNCGASYGNYVSPFYATNVTLTSR